MSLRENIRLAVQRVRRKPATCPHVDSIRDVSPDSSEGCPECLAVGDSWVHLRMCMTCGHVGCCDSSKNKHANRHAEGVAHPILRSIEPGEDWMWCVVDKKVVRRPA